MTSGNRCNEPQCITNDEARESCRDRRWLVMHDRDIVNRLDHSVARLMAGKPRVMRRARSYAPSPLPLPQDFDRAPEFWLWARS